MIKNLCVALLLTFGVTANLFAATVDFSFVPGAEAGKYDVFAEVIPDGGDVLGLAGFSFDVTGTPASGVMWTPTVLSAFDVGVGNSVGFTTAADGIIGDPATSTRFSVGATQSPSAPETNVQGIGIEPVMRETLPNPMSFDVPAHLGTIMAPAGLGLENFNSDVQVQLFPSAGGNPIAPDTLNVSFGDTGGEDPIAVGDPPSGSEISLQEAFRDLSGILEGAIMVMNDGGGDLSIDDLVISNESHPGLFGAAPNASDPLKVDLTLDLEAARMLPEDTLVTADLTVVTNGGDLNYSLSASVPEPSTVALAGLALVGVVGFCRRK